MPAPEIRRDDLIGSGERQRQAREAFDVVGARGPDAVREETLRVKAELLRQYGWDAYQLLMARIESDLARLREAR